MKDLVRALIQPARVETSALVGLELCDAQRLLEIAEERESARPITSARSHVSLEKSDLETRCLVAVPPARSCEVTFRAVEVFLSEVAGRKTKLEPRARARLGDGRAIPEAQLVETQRHGKIGEAAVIDAHPL